MQMLSRMRGRRQRLVRVLPASRRPTQAHSNAAPVVSLISWCDRVVAEVHVAVGLRPQSYTARHRLRQAVFKIELAVQIALNFGAIDANLQFVPLPRRSRRIAYPLD